MVLAGLLLFSNPGWSDKATWNQFRGPNGSGIAAEGENPPIVVGPDTNVRWKCPLLPGLSSPCIWENQIFLTAFDKDTKICQVLAIERSTGAIQWKRSIPLAKVERMHHVNNPASATPVTDGKRVFVYFASYGLLCFDMAGEALWELPLPLLRENYGNGTGTSPVLSGSSVILARDGLGDGKIIAVHGETGKMVWETPLAGKVGLMSYATPVLWRDQIVLHAAGKVVAFAAEDGTRQWTVPINSNGTSTPVLGAGQLFTGAWSNFGATE
jgi:outer membrane protein assembly factor BamB